MPNVHNGGTRFSVGTGLAHAAGGLLAPIVAHAAYDAMAISFIRWDAHGV